MNNGKNDKFQMDYRRYAAQSSPIIKSVPQKEEEATPEEEERKPAAQKTVVPPPIRLRQLQSKLDDKIVDVDTLNEFIKIGYDLGEYKLIQKYIERYLSRKPNDHATRFSLAMAMIRQGNKRKAKIELRNILNKNPKFEPARKLLERMRKEEI